MTCFVFIFLPLLIFLGFWQTSRGYEKEEIWNNYLNSVVQPPLTEDMIEGRKLANLNYRNISINGFYKEGSLLLDNRTYRNQNGYEVFSFFESELFL